MNEDRPTKDRLLRAAHELFAEQGYDRSSVRAITRRAAANLGAITYHFGSKQRLYDAVVERAFREMGDRLAAAAAGPGSALARLRGIVAAFFGFLAERPDMPRLMLHQIARGAAPPDPALDAARRNLGIIADVVRAGVAQGEVRAGTDPTLVAFSIISQAVWFAMAGRMAGAVARQPLHHPEGAARFERHVADLVTRGVAAAESAA